MESFNIASIGENIDDISSSNRVIQMIGNSSEVIDGVAYKNVNRVLFEGNEYFISHKAILTVNCTPDCNAACEFCCNGITFMPEGHYVNYSQNLRRVVSLAKLGGVNVIAYSGGEPTLFPQKFYDLVVQTAHLFKESRLHTNGMGLFLKVNDKDGNSVQLIDALVEEGLFGCSLSMAHHDREVNDRIMNFRGSYKGLDETQLRHLASLSSTTFSPRLSCVLTPDGIHTVDELLKYIEHGKSLGFKKFIFRVGTGIPDEFSTKGDFAEYNASTALNIDIFVNELMKSHGFKEIFSLHKSDSHVHVLGDGEIVLDFDQSSEEPDPDSKVRRFIYMPDGVTYTSWIDSSKLLFDDNIDIIKASVVAQLTKKLKGASPSVTHKRKQLKRIQSAEGGERFPVDLHVHTLNSDGRSTSMEVIRSAARNGFKIVFAEHNFVADDYDIVKTQAGRLGVEIPFPGIEINTVYHNDSGQPERKYHVLAYGDCLLDSGFKEYCSLPLRNKDAYFRELVENIRRDYGFDLPSYEDMLGGIDDQSCYTTPYKQQMTRTVLALYISKFADLSIDEIKERYLPPIPYSVSYATYIDTADLVTRVSEMGGVVGLAHPGWDRPMPGFEKDDERVYDVIYDLKKKGMHGVECLSRHHAPEQKAKLYEFCTHLGIILIGGSDFHGRENTSIGQFSLTYDELDTIKNILNK